MSIPLTLDYAGAPRATLVDLVAVFILRAVLIGP
jgi:hypothetical protein